MTLYLIIVSITPLVINFDTLLSNLPFGLGTEQEFIPFGYDIATAGIVYSAIFMLLTFLYQKSFLYAVTSGENHPLPMVLYERDAHRCIARRHRQGSHQAYSNGAVFGYNTIYCDIGDGSHLSTESVGGGVAIPGGGTTTTTNAEGEVKRGLERIQHVAQDDFLRNIFNGTIKTERFTPDQSFYGIRQWEEAFDLINKLQHENSMATKQDQQLEVLMQMKDMLSNNPEAAEGEEIDDLLGDI